MTIKLIQNNSNSAIKVKAPTTDIATHLTTNDNSSDADKKATKNPMIVCLCRICGYQPEYPDSRNFGSARGNSARYRHNHFKLWKCPSCETIRTLEEIDFKDAYQDYVLKKRTLNTFERGILGNLLKRLRQGKLQKTSSILDYGCGNGLFIEFLRSKGFENVTGYDPYDDRFDHPISQETQFDYVVLNDVIEHVEDPRALLQTCASHVKPGGHLYVGTSDSADIEMDDLESHLMLLHLPYHRTIFTEESLHLLGMELGWTRISSWKRSYMETLRPASNYRFMYELNKTLGHDLDRALSDDSAKAVCSSPRLMFFAFFGYFFPRAMEPALLMRRPSQT